jgi:hypothetical protein
MAKLDSLEPLLDPSTERPSPERTDPVTERTADGAGDRRQREMRKNLRDAEGEDAGAQGTDDPDAVG